MFLLSEKAKCTLVYSQENLLCVKATVDCKCESVPDITLESLYAPHGQSNMTKNKRGKHGGLMVHFCNHSSWPPVCAMLLSIVSSKQER